MKTVARHVHKISHVPRMLGPPIHVVILPSEGTTSVYWERIWPWVVVSVALVEFVQGPVGADVAVWRKKMKKVTNRGGRMIRQQMARR